MNASTYHPESEALQSRLAAHFAQALSQQTANLSHDIGERLRVSREQAVARGRLTRLQAASAVVGRTAGGAATLGAPSPWWLKFATVMPLMVLLAGLVFIEQATLREQVHAAAQIDAVLLADDLPVGAYADPGFGEFVKAPLP